MPGQIRNYGYVVYNRVSLLCEHNLGSLTATQFCHGVRKKEGAISIAMDYVSSLDYKVSPERTPNSENDSLLGGSGDLVSGLKKGDN